MLLLPCDFLTYSQDFLFVFYLRFIYFIFYSQICDPLCVDCVCAKLKLRSFLNWHTDVQFSSTTFEMSCPHGITLVSRKSISHVSLCVSRFFFFSVSLIYKLTVTPILHNFDYCGWVIKFLKLHLTRLNENLFAFPHDWTIAKFNFYTQAAAYQTQ